MEIDFGIHIPGYQFLWKNMTSGKNGTHEKPGKTRHPDNIPDGNWEKQDI